MRQIVSFFAVFLTIFLLAESTAFADSPAKGFRNSLGMEFVYIPPGTFMMGSPEDEPERMGWENQHKVTLTLGFFMQTTEVTQGQWKALMGNNPSDFKDCGDNCPVESVSWFNAQEFIKNLNKKEGGAQSFRIFPLLS